MSTYDNEVVKGILQAIGNDTVMAVCGGRMERSGPQAIRLHAGCGYRVEVTYEEGTDTFTVERLFERAGKITNKGTMYDVYVSELSTQVWAASCWRNEPPFGVKVNDNGVMVFA